MLTSDALKSIVESYFLFFMYSFCVFTCLPLHLKGIALPADECFPLGTVENVQKKSDNDWDENAHDDLRKFRWPGSKPRSTN